MSNVLVLTTDLPFFPGKNGHDFFNLSHMAKTHHVGVVSVCYESYPPAGVANLEKAVQSVYLYPRPAGPFQLFVAHDRTGGLPSWGRRIPQAWRRRILLRLLSISHQPEEAHERLAILANCAPQLLQALHDRPWHAVVLIQTSLAPWLDFLPGCGARVVYFHDVRSDYLARATPTTPPATVAAVHHQEQLACDAVDLAGFVSNLDHQRAKTLLRLPEATAVAPIPVDTHYFVPRAHDWIKDSRRIVLFTGHLRHPPNVDAVLHFLADIWPLVLKQMPDVFFQAVGMSPDPRLEEAMARAQNAELHASVPDIRPYFWNADIYVVPMRFGGGVRQKIFEAWAMRVPVISTPMGAEGIDARSGENCWLEATPAGFGARVMALLQQDPDSELPETAQRQVNRTNSIAVAADAFTQLVGRGVATRRKRPFRLLYDLRWMEIGKAGGAEQMTFELISTISRLDQRNQYRLYCPRSTFHEWAFPRGFHVKGIYSDPAEQANESLLAMATNRIAESLALPAVLTRPMRTLRALRRMDFDLVHSMVGYTHPDLAAFPHVLTALDLQHLHHPEFFTDADWRVRDAIYRESANQAKHIICISEYTRQDMHQHYQVPLEKMTTIWLIPSRQVWSPPPPAVRHGLLGAMGLQKPFLYFPAHGWLHKNHARLVEAFALIQPHLPEDLLLVFSGKPFETDHPAHELIRQHSLGHRVRHLGYRSPLEVQALLHGCFALVFPSLFEGFGIPVMDAIIAGKPVACSNRTSLPEIAGEAALTFDPLNIHDIGGRLLEVINDPARRDALVEAGRQRRPLFSPRLSAVKTLAVYQQVYEELLSD